MNKATLSYCVVKDDVALIDDSPVGGVQTGKYLGGIPVDVRAAADPRFLKPKDITGAKQNIVHKLNAIAENRGQ